MVLQRINKDLLPIKAHYFFYNAGTSPVVPFLSIYARQLGFSSVVVGTIYTFLPIAGMLAKPLFGAVADHFRIQKVLFLAFQVVTAVAFLSINFIPEMPTESGVKFSCDHAETFIYSCLDGNATRDECTVSKVLSETGHNGTIRCKMQCSIPDAAAWDTVCENWNAPQYCKSSEKQFPFIAVLDAQKTLLQNPCVHFKVSRVILTDNAMRQPFCPVGKNASHPLFLDCEANCDSIVINDLITRPKVGHREVTGMYQFWLFVSFLTVAWVGMAVVVSVGDAICFGMLGDRPNRYGNQRLWGSVGWGLFSILAGVLVDAFSKGKAEKDYSSVFYLAVILLLLDLVVSYRLKYNQNRLSPSIVRDVGRLLANPRIFIFILWCIFVGLCTGLIWQFLFWLLEDLAKAQGCGMQERMKTLEGLVMGIQCLAGELPFFFLSGWILKRIGHVNAMSLVLLTFGVRYILYSVIKNPWWVLPIELTNGLTFGLFYATMASYASIVAPPGTEATTQGLVGAIFEGIGVSLGSLLGGLLYKAYGGSTTFQIFGICSLVACLVHALVQYYVQKRHILESKVSARYAAPQEAANITDDHQGLTLVE